MSIEKALESIRNRQKDKVASKVPLTAIKGPNWHEGRPCHPVHRTVMIMTHYKAPNTWGPNKLADAEKVWRDLFAKAEKCDDAPPEEIVRAVEADMNTPRAFTDMERYARQGDGKKLWAAMNFLGLIPAEDFVLSSKETAKKPAAKLEQTKAEEAA